jgi:hypothetical protein
MEVRNRRCAECLLALSDWLAETGCTHVRLIDTLPTETVWDLRDRALIATLMAGLASPISQ